MIPPDPAKCRRYVFHLARNAPQYPNILKHESYHMIRNGILYARRFSALIRPFWYHKSGGREATMLGLRINGRGSARRVLLLVMVASATLLLPYRPASAQEKCHFVCTPSVPKGERVFLTSVHSASFIAGLSFPLTSK